MENLLDKDTNTDEKLQDLFAEIRYIAYQVECIMKSLKELIDREQ